VPVLDCEKDVALLDMEFVLDAEASTEIEAEFVEFCREKWDRATAAADRGEKSLSGDVEEATASSTAVLAGCGVPFTTALMALYSAVYVYTTQMKTNDREMGNGE
jgi:hypothetical protein